MRVAACTIFTVSCLVLTACGSSTAASGGASAAPPSETTMAHVPAQNNPETAENAPAEKPTSPMETAFPEETDGAAESGASPEPVIENLPPDFPSEVPLLGFVAPESVGTDLTRKLYDGMWSVSMRSLEPDEDLNKELAGRLLLDAGFTKNAAGDFSNGNYEVGFFVVKSLLTYAVRAT